MQLLSLFLLVLLAPPAWASPGDDVCFSTSSFRWTSIGTTDPPGSWDCSDGPGDDVPDGQDLFEIRRRHTVTIPSNGSIVFSKALHAVVDGTSLRNQDAGIEVRRGGGLILESNALITCPQGVAIAEGANGNESYLCLLAERGSTLEIGTDGVFRSATSSTKTRDPESWFAAGRIIPAPGTGGSCGTMVEPDPNGFCRTEGDRDTVRIEWNAALVSSPGELEAGLVAIDERDILWWHDPDERDEWAPADVNAAYHIEAVDSDSPIYSIDYDATQQGEYDPQDPSSSPLSERHVKECELSVDIAEGQTTFTTTPSCLAADGERAGQWVYFQEGTERCRDGDSTRCEVLQTPYRLYRTEDGGSGDDSLSVIDPRGLHRDFPSACGNRRCRVWIMRGGPAGAAEGGDPFLVIDAVTLNSATRNADCDGNAEDCGWDSQLRVDGAKIDVTGLTADSTGRWFIEGAGVAIEQLRYVNTWNLSSHIWVQFGICAQTAPAVCAADHISMAGLNEQAVLDNDTEGCLSRADPSVPGTLNVSQITLRDCGGGGFIQGGGSGTNLSVVNASFARAEYGAATGYSPVGGGLVRDASFADTGKPTGSTIDAVFERVMVIEPDSMSGMGGKNRGQTQTLRNVTWIGGSNYTKDLIAGVASGPILDNAVFRDITVPLNRDLFQNNTDSAALSLKRVLLKNITTGGWIVRGGGAMTLQDVIVLNPERLTPGPGGILIGDVTNPGLRLRRVALIQTDDYAGPRNYEHGFNAIVDAGNAGHVMVETLMVGGFTNGTAFQGDRWDDMARCRRLYSVDNGSHQSSPETDGCAPFTKDGTLQVSETPSADPAPPGRPAVRAGVSDMSWAHHVNRTVPEMARVFVGRSAP